MLTLDKIRLGLLDRQPGMVAEATGLHLNTVRAVRDNPNANPSYSTLIALSDYLEKSMNEVRE